jgi:hypothetical protein
MNIYDYITVRKQLRNSQAGDFQKNSASERERERERESERERERGVEREGGREKEKEGEILRDSFKVHK